MGKFHGRFPQLVRQELVLHRNAGEFRCPGLGGDHVGRSRRCRLRLVFDPLRRLQHGCGGLIGGHGLRSRVFRRRIFDVHHLEVQLRRGPGCGWAP